MKVVGLGVSLLSTYPNAKGHHLSDLVILRRPNVPIKQANVSVNFDHPTQTALICNVTILSRFPTPIPKV